jgi:hypothetical protein
MDHLAPMGIASDRNVHEIKKSSCANDCIIIPGDRWKGSIIEKLGYLIYLAV